MELVKKGMAHAERGEFPEALELLQRALTMYTDVQDDKNIAEVSSGIAIVYANTSSYPESLQFFEHAKEAYERIGDLKQTAAMLSSIAGVHSESGDFARSHQLMQQALDLFDEVGESAAKWVAVGNLGILCAKEKNFDDALQHLRMAIDKLVPLKHHNVFWFKTELGLTLAESGSAEVARLLIDELDQTPLDQPIEQIALSNLKANVEQALNDLDSALLSFQNSLHIAQTHGMLSRVADAHLCLRDLALQRNDFAAYVEHNNEFMRIEAEVRGKETSLKLAMHAKEKELSAERGERERERALLYGALPKHIADRMIRGDSVSGDHFDETSVLFLDVVGFTTISDTLSPTETVQLLESVFGELDRVCGQNNITKIKTIGDSYMAVAGVDAPLI